MLARAPGPPPACKVAAGVSGAHTRGGHTARGTSSDGDDVRRVDCGRRQPGVVAGARLLLRPHDAEGGLCLPVVVAVDLVDVADADASYAARGTDPV